MTKSRGIGRGGPRQVTPPTRRDVKIRLYSPHAGQAKLHRSQARFRLAVCGRRWGKALALDTPLPTPTGWTTIGDVKVGDALYDENGSPCRVTYATEIQLGNRCYRVSFDDGTSVVADGDHRWLTHDKLTRKSLVRFPDSSTHAPAVRTTTEIAATLLYARPDGRTERNHSIPVAGPLACAEADLPVDPYVLGVWLGDGSKHWGIVAIGDDDAEEILGYLAEAGEPVSGRPRRKPGAKCASYPIGGRPPKQGPSGFVSDGSLHSRLKSLGVLCNKHIPAVYLRASAEQRLALLRGLMDTDGHLERGRHAEIIQVNRRLAFDALELIRSLGMKPTLAVERATLNGRDCGPRYRISFTPNVQVFRLSRKASSWRSLSTHLTVTAHRRIVSVESVPSVAVRCISVDSPSHLFLCGEGMVPTHNTLAACNEVAKYCWENPEWRGLSGNEPPRPTMTWWVAPTYGQSVKAFNVMAQGFAGAIAKKKSAVGQMSLTWKNGAVTEFQSAERYDNLRGEGVRFMVIDEAAMVSKAAWTEVLRPMLTDTMGRALIISTPKGRNWFYELYQRGIDPEQTDYESFSFPTSSSPYIENSEVEEARLTLPEDTFAQEYLGAFLDEAAGVFHGIDDCIYGELEEPLADHKYVIGWDIAKKADFSVVTVIDTDHYRDTVPTAHVASFDRFNTLSYTVQADRVQEITRRYHTYVLLDSTGLGDPVYDMLCARGVPCYPYVFTSRSKEMLIQNLAIDIQSKSLSYPDIPILQHELHAYQYTLGPTGRLSYSAPEGDHDDCVVSLALADWAARHPAWLAEPTLFYDEDEIISPI